MAFNHPGDKRANFSGSILFFFFIILIAGLFALYYQNKTNQQEQEVEFWLQQKEEEIIGESSVFFVFIRNRELKNLENVEAIVNFPNGFIFESSQPSCSRQLEQGCAWAFDKIKRGELKEIEIRGRFFGAADEVKGFEGWLNFHLAGFTSEFQKKFVASKILKPEVFLDWQMPEELSFGQKIKSTISFKNISRGIIEEGEIIIKWPEGFIFQKSKGFLTESGDRIEIDEENRQLKWRFNGLNIETQKELELEGFVKNPVIQEVIVDLEAGVFNQNKFYSQIKEQKRILVEKFDFAAILEVNNSRESKQNYNWGQTIPVNLIYTNHSPLEIKNLILKLKLTGGEYLDFDRLYQSRWYYYQSANTATSSAFISGKFTPFFVAENNLFQQGEWTEELISVLKEVKPGAEGMITFDLPIKAIFEATKNNYSQAEVVLQILVQGKLVEQNASWEIQGNEIIVPINTDLRLEAIARYYDEEHIPLGAGPLPPQVSKETYFWIFLQVENTTNPVKDILIETKLPAGVVWTGRSKSSQGAIFYQEMDREMSWRISELAAYQGGPHSLVEAGFEIKILPQDSQVGLIIPLTEKIFLSAEDKWTNELISQEINYLDTNLDGDFWGQNKGVIIPE